MIRRTSPVKRPFSGAPVSIALTVLAFCNGGTLTAHAQSPAGPQKIDKPFSVRLGSNSFGDSGTRKTIGSSTSVIGLGYDFYRTSGDMPITLQGYADYYTPQDKTVTDAGVRTKTKLSSLFGIGVTARYPLTRTVESSRVFPYVGAGLGYYSSKVRRESDEGGSVTTGARTEGGVGARLFAGGTLRGGYIGEIEYAWLPSNGPVKPSGFAVRAGYRF
jgi:hypothetical protein